MLHSSTALQEHQASQATRRAVMGRTSKASRVGKTGANPQAGSASAGFLMACEGGRLERALPIGSTDALSLNRPGAANPNFGPCHTSFLRPSAGLKKPKFRIEIMPTPADVEPTPDDLLASAIHVIRKTWACIRKGPYGKQVLLQTIYQVYDEWKP